MFLHPLFHRQPIRHTNNIAKFLHLMDLHPICTCDCTKFVVYNVSMPVAGVAILIVIIPQLAIIGGEAG
jgi:hypothetical protein